MEFLQLYQDHSHHHDHDPNHHCSHFRDAETKAQRIPLASVMQLVNSEFGI